MACIRIPCGFICVDDDFGSAFVNDREYRWSFNEWLGPLFLRKDGAVMKRQPGEKHPIWPHFEKWLAAREGTHAKG